MAREQATRARNGGQTAAQNGQNGSEPTAEQRSLAEAVAYEVAIRERADQVRDEEGYARQGGRLTAGLLMKLHPLLTEPIHRHHIRHVPANSQTYKDRNGNEKPWPPHDMTGINGGQVQASRMSNVLGRAHWREIKTYAKEGQIAHVFVIVGNDLVKARVVDGQLDPNGAEVLICEDGYGSYNRGPDVGNHYKGSATSADKRVFARVGPGEEVYRQEADPELQPEATEAPDPDAAPAQTRAIERIDGARVAVLTDMAQSFVEQDDDEDERKERRRRVATLLASEGATGKTVSERIASLTPVMADSIEGQLAEWNGGKS